MPRLPARLPAPATVARQIEGYWSGDHRSRRGDEDVQHCYSHSWRIALLERFWQARHPPRYAAYLTPSSPSFPLSSAKAVLMTGRIDALTMSAKDPPPAKLHIASRHFTLPRYEPPSVRPRRFWCDCVFLDLAENVLRAQGLPAGR